MGTQPGMSLKQVFFDLPGHHDDRDIFCLRVLPEVFQKDKPLDLGNFDVGDNKVRLLGQGEG